MGRPISEAMWRVQALHQSRPVLVFLFLLCLRRRRARPRRRPHDQDHDQDFRSKLVPSTCTRTLEMPRARTGTGKRTTVATILATRAPTTATMTTNTTATTKKIRTTTVMTTVSINRIAAATTTREISFQDCFHSGLCSKSGCCTHTRVPSKCSD